MPYGPRHAIPRIDPGDCSVNVVMLGPPGDGRWGLRRACRSFHRSARRPPIPTAGHMTVNLLLVELLNGAAVRYPACSWWQPGLTLVFGVMNFINLAHGVQYMLGAYLAASLGTWSGSFLDRHCCLRCRSVAADRARCWSCWFFAICMIAPTSSQVLATFGVILTLEEAVRAIWGSAPLNVLQPEGLGGGIADHAGPDLSDLSAGDHRRRPGHRPAAVAAGGAHAGRHAGARRARPIRRSSRCWGVEHSPPIHHGVRLRRHAGWVWPARWRVRSSPSQPVHGRRCPDPGLRGDRHRRASDRFAVPSSRL